MTEILDATLSHSFTRSQENSCISDICHTLQEKQLFYVQNHDQTVNFSFPLSLLKSFAKNQLFHKFLLYFTVTFNKYVIEIKANLHNQHGIQIKAQSTHQKTLLIKHSLAINQKNIGNFVFVHPLTGQILFRYHYCIPQLNSFQSVFQNFMLTLKNNDDTFVKILSSLQLIPFQSCSTITLYSKIQQSFRPILPLLSTTSLYIANNQATKQQKIHQKYFGSASYIKSSIDELGNLNLFEKMKKAYIQQFLSMFVHNSTKIKKHNLTYLNVESTPNVQSLLKSIENHEFPLHNIPVQSSFIAQNKNYSLLHNHMRSELVSYQYSVVDKTSKKKIYYTFLKQYIVFINYLKITDYYIITKKQDSYSQTLFLYLKKNKLCISFQTKMKIVSQIIAISHLCLQQIQGLQPSFSLNNIYIDENFIFKLGRLSKAQIQPRTTVIQSIRAILLNQQYYYLRGKQMKKTKHISIQSNELKFKGPSTLLKILIKSMQNIQSSLQTDNKGIQQLKKLLLIVNKASDIYQKAIDLIPDLNDIYMYKI